MAQPRIGSGLSSEVNPSINVHFVYLDQRRNRTMVERVNLSAATSANILTLEKTTRAITLAQARLATGLRVASAQDNAAAFFAAQSLNSRSSQLLVLKDGIGQAATSVDTAVNGLEAIQAVVDQLRGLAVATKSDSDLANRSKAAVQFNDLRGQLDNLANDSNFGGVNLIKGSPGNLRVTFSEDGSSTLTVSGVASDSSGLSITTAAANWDVDANIDLAINDLDSALTTLRATANTLSSSTSFITLRLDFVSNLINSLDEGAGKLVNADLNSEAAGLLTLQTRQQLATISLSIASQSDQSVFRLF